MTYDNIWRKTLNDSEQVLHEFSVGEGFRVFGVIVALAATLIVVVALYFVSAMTGLSFWLPVVVGALMLLMAFGYFGLYLPTANAYAFTNERVLAHYGWLSTSETSIFYDQITDVSVKDPVLERWFTDTGYVIINTAGSDKDEIVLNHVQKPFQLKKRLDELRHNH